MADAILQHQNVDSLHPHEITASNVFKGLWLLLNNISRQHPIESIEFTKITDISCHGMHVSSSRYIYRYFLILPLDSFHLEFVYESHGHILLVYDQSLHHGSLDRACACGVAAKLRLGGFPRHMKMILLLRSGCPHGQKTSASICALD